MVGSIFECSVIREVLDGLARQIRNAKEELNTLHLSLEEQIKKLPIGPPRTSREVNNIYQISFQMICSVEQFEVADIVEHFQREKRRVNEELRVATINLSDGK